MSTPTLSETVSGEARKHRWITALAGLDGIMLYDFVLSRPEYIYRRSDVEPYPSIHAEALSRDGSHIAFVLKSSNSASLVLVNLHTREERRILEREDIAELSWSPDSREIAFTAVYNEAEQTSGRFGLFVVDLQTGRDTTLLKGANYALTNQAWSPDGHQLVFSFKSENGGEPTVGIYDLQSRSWRELVQNAGGASWSPTGNVIAYFTFEKDDAIVHVITPDGREKKSLLKDASRTDPLMTPVVWSPDGNYLLYGRLYAKDPVGSVPYIFELNTQREEAVPLALEYFGLAGYHSWAQKR